MLGGGVVSKRAELFIGDAQKAGTTALFRYMAQWPALAGPARKEPHFFDDENQNWRAPDYAAYHAWFPPADARMRFEGTPVTLFLPACLPRIRSYNPDAKFIFLFREPASRAYSHWRMQVRQEKESRSFSEAIRAPAIGRAAYIERGLYAEQLDRAVRIFPRAQMLFLNSADLAARHNAVLRRVARFIGIAQPTPVAAMRTHGGVAAEEPLAEDVAFLRDRFAEDQKRFHALYAPESLD